MMIVTITTKLTVAELHCTNVLTRSEDVTYYRLGLENLPALLVQRTLAKVTSH